METPKPAPTPGKGFKPSFGGRMDRKKMAIYGGAAVLILALVLVAPGITGFVTASSALSRELNSTKENLTLCRNDLGAASTNLESAKNDASSCQNSLGDTQNSLQSCNDEKSSMQTFVDSCRSDISGLSNQIGDLQNDVDKYKTGYDALAENYAFDACCTRGITEAQWDVVDNAIICGNGTMTVTC